MHHVFCFRLYLSRQGRWTQFEWIKSYIKTSWIKKNDIGNAIVRQFVLMQVGHQRKSDYSKTVNDILSFFTFLFKIVTMKHFFQIKNLFILWPVRPRVCSPKGKDNRSGCVEGCRCPGLTGLCCKNLKEKNKRVLKTRVFRWIGHFRITFGLNFKMSPGAHSFIWQ